LYELTTIRPERKHHFPQPRFRGSVDSDEVLLRNDYTAMWLRGTGTVSGAKPRDPPTFATGFRDMAEASNAAAISRAERSMH
jgi:hypothetical protein